MGSSPSSGHQTWPHSGVTTYQNQWDPNYSPVPFKHKTSCCFGVVNHETTGDVRALPEVSMVPIANQISPPPLMHAQSTYQTIPVNASPEQSHLMSSASMQHLHTEGSFMHPYNPNIHGHSTISHHWEHPSPPLPHPPPLVEEELASWATSRPMYTTNRPMYTTSRPMYTTSRPMYTSARPMYTSGRPMYTSGRPMYTSGRPMYTSGRPMYT